ncbi:MAG: hypothetical protein HZA89_17565 [Verrucomicrobia bacterium]|nr:hypothetical protein [Verrucomicrobiota bacterium]
MWLAAVGLGAFHLGAGTKVFSTSQFTSVQSRTGQFVVTSPNPPGAFVAPSVPLALPKPPTDKIDLEPAQTAVIGERIKEAVLREFGMKDQWRGKILILLRPASQTDGQVHLQNTRYHDGWQYRIEMPDQVETNRLVRALAQTVLQEISNRHSSDRSAELPLWLSEGLAALLLDTHPTSFLLNLNTQISFTTRHPDALRVARLRLNRETALSFSDLNLPAEEQLHGAAWETYRRSAQVFVASLLNLPGGRAAMQDFLQRLPNYLNPQLAFLQAFAAHFQSPLDVEKWWSITLVNFTGRDQHSRWSTADVLQRLDEILRSPVERRAGTNNLPQRGELPLQQFFSQMDFAQQRPLVQQRMQQLQFLQWNAPSELARLIADYHAALAAYLQRRDNLGAAPVRGRAPDSARLAAAEAVKQLDLLDVIRQDMSAGEKPVAKNSPDGKSGR